MFRFDETATPSQVEEIKRALLDLPKQIKEIRDYELGTDLELAAGQTHPLGKNRTLAWSATFDSIADYQTYDASEAHAEFLGRLKLVVDKTSRAAIQYKIPEESS